VKQQENVRSNAHWDPPTRAMKNALALSLALAAPQQNSNRRIRIAITVQTVMRML
jgi:hypothetical protein